MDPIPVILIDLHTSQDSWIHGWTPPPMWKDPEWPPELEETQRCLQPETWPYQDSFSPYLGFNSLFLYVSFYVIPDWLSSVTGDGHLSSQTNSFNSFRPQIGSSCVSSSVWKTLGSDSDLIWVSCPPLSLPPVELGLHALHCDLLCGGWGDWVKRECKDWQNLLEPLVLN